MKRSTVLAACLIVLVSARLAAFDWSIGGDVILSTNIASYTYTDTGALKGAGTNQFEPTKELEFFQNFAFGDTNVTARFWWEDFGVKLTVKPAHPSGDTSNWWLGAFDDSYVWWDFLNFTSKNTGFSIKARLQAGEFESTSINGLNSVVDEWSFGGFYYDSSTGPNVSSLLGNDSIVYQDMMKHLIFSFSVGPVKLEYSPVSIGDFNAVKNSNSFTRGNVISSVNEDSRMFVSSARLSTEPLFGGMFRASALYNLTYAWNRQKRNEDGGEKTRTNPEKIQFINRYGAAVELHLPQPLGLEFTLAYAGQMNEYARDWGSVASSYLTDVMNTVELRARWRPHFLDERLIVENHHKVSFGRGVGDLVNDDARNADIVFDKYSTNLSNFSNMRVYWNAIGGAYWFRDDMRLSLVVVDRYARIFKKTGEGFYAGNELIVKSAFRYYVASSVYVEAGVNVTLRNLWAANDDGSAIENNTLPSKVMTVAVPFKVSLSF